MSRTTPRRWAAAVAAVAAMVVVLASCGSGGGPSSTPAASASAAPPSAHVHAVDRDPGTGQVLLATHDGLFVHQDGRFHRVGPAIDLMGFTVAGPGHYYASGHPGPGADLPEPAGLIQTRDAGRTWTVLSRGGRSDFHALTSTAGGVVGFDGQALTSTDGRSWTASSLQAPPRSLAGSPDHHTVLATTEHGLMRSADGGRSWHRVPDAPLLYLVDWADGHTAVGVTPTGQLHITRDAGQTWTAMKQRVDQPQALSASGHGPRLLVLAVTAEQALQSRGGHGFTTLPGRT